MAKKLPQLYCSTDVAKFLGIKSTSVPGMMKRNKSFPEPAQIIGNGPIWLAEDIILYKERRDAKFNTPKRSDE